MSKSIEKYRKAFTAADLDGIEQVRLLRREAWTDDRLGPIEQKVLGSTGSFEQLWRLLGIAKTIGACLGQPLLVIESVRTDGRVGRVRGGLIMGRLFVESSSSNMGTNGHRGHVIFNVQVAPLVTHHASGHVEVHSNPNEFSDDMAVTASHLINHEAANHTADPSGDYDEVMPFPPLVGSHAIKGSQYYDLGLQDVLQIVDAAALRK